MSWIRRPAPFTPLGALGPEDPDRPPRILVVCTGNICRSAYAHHVLTARLDADLGAGAVEVASAGTGANQALAVPAEILGLAPDAAVRDALTAHRPRQLTRRMLAGQDLVLAATDAHLDQVLREDPGAVRRCFTLLEAGRLAAQAGDDVVAPGAGLRALTDGLGRARSRAGRRPEDLPDPFRGSVEDYAAMRRALDPALEAIAAAVVRAVRG